MRVTLKMLQEVINVKDHTLMSQNDLIVHLRSQVGDAREAGQRMLATISAQKQALRLAGEAIKTTADAIPTK